MDAPSISSRNNALTLVLTRELKLSLSGDTEVTAEGVDGVPMLDDEQLHPGCIRLIMLTVRKTEISQ